MAKLGDLKRLLDEAKPVGSAAPAAAAGSPASSRGTGHPAPPSAGARPAKPTSPADPTFRSSMDPKPPSPKRMLGAAKHADGDIDLARAFADVQKLSPHNRARIERPRPAPIPQHTLADERDVLIASKYGDSPAPQAWDTGQEFEHEQTFVRAGLGTDLASKLRRGHWSVQGELDLHGMIVDEAHDALSDFIVAARHRRYRCVRVIHGKGLTSPNKEPVLKGKVRRWLAHWDEVLAYTEAPRHAGGGGAILVLLKGS